MFWFRYHAIEKEKFNFRVGAHPALSIQLNEVIDDGQTYEISQLYRFAAFEVAPHIQASKHLGIGLYNLLGFGLQNYGAQRSRFFNLYITVSNIAITSKVKFSLTPSIYYLNLDSYEGFYYTANAKIQHDDLPFSFQSSINKTITSDLPGNKDFLWNVSVHYHISRTMKSQ